MPHSTRLRRAQLLPLSALGLFLCLCAGGANTENVILKNGIVYRGTVDRDNTLIYVFDGLKRIVVRDSKVARREPDTTFGNWEVFRIEQPLVQHAGVMPKEAFNIRTTPWNEFGRRSFQYVSGRSGKPISMEQAIYELGPYLVRFRGVDGFWQDGRLSTGQVPHEVVLGLLARVERKNQNERRRVASFLIQAEWYADAKAELDSLLQDFPDDASLLETVKTARAFVAQLEAAEMKADIDVRRRAQQYRTVADRLKTFPTKEVASKLLVDLREQMRKDDAEAAADRSLAAGLRALKDKLSSETQKEWKKPLSEVFQDLTQAPEAVRDRFVAWQKVKDDAAVDDQARFALAMSGYVVGADVAVRDLAAAANLWKLRDTLREYLASAAPDARPSLLDRLQSIPIPEEPEAAGGFERLDILTRLAVRMPPPLHDEKEEAAGKPKPRIHRVTPDENAAPTDYTVLLPPEYHPLRSYPAVVALHGGAGPQSAIDWWAAEAARRGYIIVAPEYRLPGSQQQDYGYTSSEHAAVELALRDARRRYAIDGDRVFLGGQLHGGDMAWDYGLAHPDLFAGVAVVSGRPFKYAFRYFGPQVEKLPFYVALGDLAPAASELIFGGLLKGAITRAQDVTYVEYYRRGLEDLPEEAPAIFDWMDRRRRDPYPKSFDVVTARETDQRFYGVVVREFLPGRTTAPEAAEPLGKNLNPASIKMTSSSLSNLVKVDVVGIRRLDVWLSPRLVDFKKRLEVRVNRRPFFRGTAKPNIEPFLEDLRLRGDRQQIYWLKVSAG